MGKRHHKGSNNAEDRKRRKQHAENWKNTRGDDPNNKMRGSWADSVTDNKRFQAFYKAQHFVADGDDWEKFMGHLRQPLPACFRINPDYAFADELRNQLMGFVGKTITVDDVEIKAVEQMPWYPNGHGYKMGTDRRSIRKLDALTQLHKWLVMHTENGNITRQEAVSMIPPLALNVSPHHKCLDVCAAPGSKTSQLLEIVNRSLSNPGEEQGLVVANDADTDRAYMLVHQCKRINSPLLIVTTHKGQMLPSIHGGINAATGKPTEFFDRVLCDVPCSGDGTLRKNPTIWSKWNTSMGTTLHPLQLMIAQRGLQLLKSDGLMVYSTCSLSPYENEAVVAELLRSSGGTLELVDARQFLPLFKARPGLSTWNVLDDYFASRRELNEKRAAQRLKQEQQKAAKAAATAAAGGLGAAAPSEEQEGDEEEEEEEQQEEKAEDDVTASAGAECVDGISEAMDTEGAAAATEGVVVESDNRGHRIDYSHITDPHLLAAIELGMIYYPDWESVPDHMRDSNKIRKSFFPPTAEEAEWMHLERCLRCVPQDEDTGGFFVATLRRKGEPVTVLPLDGGNKARVEAAPESAGEAAAAPAPAASSSSSSSSANKGLVDFHHWDISDFNKMRDYYGLDDTMPAESMFVREDFATTAKNQANKVTTKSKSVYFIPPSARALMSGDREGRLKIVTAGVKMFERKDLSNGEHDYRLLQEGIAYIAPHISKRKVNVTIQDFCNILGGGLVSLSTMSPQSILAISAMGPGVLICVYDFKPEDVLPSAAAGDAEKAEETTLTAPKQHTFYAICWKGNARALNCMCGKIDIEFMKHQLEALNVLRPKIQSERSITNAAMAAAAAAAAAKAQATSPEGTTEQPAEESEAVEVVKAEEEEEVMAV